MVACLGIFIAAFAVSTRASRAPEASECSCPRTTVLVARAASTGSTYLGEALHSQPCAAFLPRDRRDDGRLALHKKSLQDPAFAPRLLRWLRPDDPVAPLGAFNAKAARPSHARGGGGGGGATAAAVGAASSRLSLIHI